MNIERFKEEFNELRCRFTATDDDKNPQSIGVPLTNQEILEAVHDVLNLKLDVTLVDSMRDDVKTPATGIVMTTPNAPDIPKPSTEHSGGMPGRYRSLDTLTSESRKDSLVDDLILPKPGPLTSKVEDDNVAITIKVPDGQVEDRKYMSKSSPAMSTLVRSDTFVREEEFESVKSGDVFGEKNADPIETNEVGTENMMTEATLIDIMQNLTILRGYATDVVKKIDDIKFVTQKGVPEIKRPIRRLSAMGSFPGLNRTSAAAKSTQRTKMTRRSMAAFPGTPTSSRLSPSAADRKDVENLRRKSASALSLNMDGSKLSIPSTYRSVSSGSIEIPKKKSPDNLSPPHSSSKSQGSLLPGVKPPRATGIRSPALSLLSTTNPSPSARQAKNPKYAHVQSTIPKTSAILGKRKNN